MKRGEVRWVDFEYPDKRRPAVIVTRDSAIGYLATVTVAPITNSIHRAPSEVLLTPEDGLPVECAANLHNLDTVRKTRVGGLITVLSQTRMGEIETALCFALGMERRLK